MLCPHAVSAVPTGLMPLQLETPFGENLLGINIGRGFGALKRSSAVPRTVRPRLSAVKISSYNLIPLESGTALKRD